MMKIPSLALFSAFLLAGAAAASAQTLTYTSSNSNGPASVPANLLATVGTLTAQSGGFGDEGSGPISVLTDNSPGNPNTGNNATGGWDAIETGSSLTYTLNTTTNTAGYTINAIDLVSGWGDFGRANVLNVTVSYQLVGGTTFTTLLNGSTITNQNLAGGGNGVYEDVRYANSNGTTPLISGVKAIRFDFGAQQNGYIGYRELDIQGAATAVPEPSSVVLGFLGLGLLTLCLRLRRRVRPA